MLFCQSCGAFVEVMTSVKKNRDQTPVVNGVAIYFLNSLNSSRANRAKAAAFVVSLICCYCYHDMELIEWFNNSSSIYFKETITNKLGSLHFDWFS